MCSVRVLILFIITTTTVKTQSVVAGAEALPYESKREQETISHLQRIFPLWYDAKGQVSTELVQRIAQSPIDNKSYISSLYQKINEPNDSVQVEEVWFVQTAILSPQELNSREAWINNLAPAVSKAMFAYYQLCVLCDTQYYALYPHPLAVLYDSNDVPIYDYRAIVDEKRIAQNTNWQNVIYVLDKQQGSRLLYLYNYIHQWYKEYCEYGLEEMNKKRRSPLPPGWRWKNYFRQ